MPPVFRFLPAPPVEQPGQPRAHYCAALFAWFLTDDANTITPTDLQLEQAQYGARIATDVRGALPAFYDAVANAERTISAAIRRRAAAAQVPAESPASAPEPRKPNEGPMAPLTTPPDVNPQPPTTYADTPTPSRAAAELYAAFRQPKRDNIRF